ncbi:hypothetical protein CRM22_009623, partial [Opisthorchis felineus]
MRIAINTSTKLSVLPIPMASLTCLVVLVHILGLWVADAGPIARDKRIYKGLFGNPAALFKRIDEESPIYRAKRAIDSLLQTYANAVIRQKRTYGARPVNRVKRTYGGQAGYYGYGQQRSGYAQQQRGYGQQRSGYGYQHPGYAQQWPGYGQQRQGYAQQWQAYVPQWTYGYYYLPYGYGNRPILQAINEIETAAENA